jgi:hypothetical protein
MRSGSLAAAPRSRTRGWRTASGDRQVADLIDDQESVAGDEADALLELSLALGLG